MERDNSEGWSEEDTKNEKNRPHSGDIVNEIDSRKFKSELVEEIDFRKCKSDENKNLPCDDSLEYIDLSKYKTFSECQPWELTGKGRNARNDSRPESSFRSRNGGSDGIENLDSRELAYRIHYAPQKDLRIFKSNENKILPSDGILEKSDPRKHLPNDEQHSTFGEWPSWKSTCNGRNAHNKSRHEPSVRSRTEGGGDGFENSDSRELASMIKSAPRKDVFDQFNYGRNAGNEPRLEAPLRNRNERENEGFENLDSGELTDRLKYTPPKGVFDQRSYAYDVEASDIARKRREYLLSLHQSFSTGWTTTTGLFYQSAF